MYSSSKVNASIAANDSTPQLKLHAIAPAHLPGTYPAKLPSLLTSHTAATDSTASVQYRYQLIDWLHQHMPFGGACCTLVDPDSLLSVGAVVEQRLHNIHTELLRYEYAHADAADSYMQLVHQEPPVSVLSQHQSDILTAHMRYRELLQPAGFGDELRAAMMYKGRCWGFLTLYRLHEQPLFSVQDTEWVVRLIPAIAAQLRLFCLNALQELHKTADANYHSDTSQSQWSKTPPAEKGILLLSEQLESLSANRAAAEWLDRLRQHENETSSALPRPLHTAALKLLQQPADTPTYSENVQSCVPAHGYYVWMRVHLVHTATNERQVMIELEPAPPELLFRLHCEQFSLTTREQQLIRHALNGLSTRQIAATLYISSFTVQDHLKSIFAKTGTSSRRELLALLRNPLSSSANTGTKDV